MKRLQLTVTVLVGIVASALGQAINVKLSNTELIITADNLTAMTALQFNLELPEGVTLTDADATMGEATASHTLCIETLDNGDLLFILYSMNLNTFKDGELLRIPVNINDDGTARLYNVRFADTDAVSHAGAETATGIKALSNAPLKGENIYNLSGQRVDKMQKGIYIKEGRKILSK